MNDSLILNNGISIPAIGLGVYQSSPAETAEAVDTAIRSGYRHIDTASFYRNEREVGQGVRRSGVDRSGVFIETKVWVSDYGYEETLAAFGSSALKLGVDEIDLVLLHQPMPQHFDRTVEAYRALERLLADGRVRAIGVSNFMPHHLVELRKRSEVVPAVNQIELHPYFTQTAVQQANADLGILTQAWSPIGGVTFYPGFGDHRSSVLDDVTIQSIANAHGKTPAQVLLRWHLQEGRSAIPKSTNPARISQNIDVFDFELSTHDLYRIGALNRGVRGGPDPDEVDPSMFDLESSKS
jgi:2,5-diketo-D-gluconate reductase A